MQTSLRTTIFWNIFILMLFAIGLISIVVLRVTERELIAQRTDACELVFLSISEGVAEVLSGSFDQTLKTVKVQRLLERAAERELFQRALFAGPDMIIAADSGKKMENVGSVDSDIQKLAGLADGFYKRTSYDRSAGSPVLIIAGEVYIDTKSEGFLKAVFSLEDIEQSISRSRRIIFAYILFNSAVLIMFGFFLLHRYILRPIKKLIAFTETVSEHGFEGSLLHSSERNEIGKLSYALKNMAERIKNEKKKLENKVFELEEKNIQLKHAQRQIIQSEKLASVGRLAAGIAHEIGNPVAIIMGFIHMLKKKELDERKRKECLDRMEAETERASNIIKELLDFAQPSSRNLEYVDLNKIIKDVYQLVSYQKEFSSIETEFYLEEKIPFLFGNEKHLRQVVLNLLLNASDAMPQGGRVGFITKNEESAQGVNVVFSIYDTGSGISPDDKKKVFDPFFTTKKSGRGTGLGLSNVQRIVETYGGSIRVESDLHKGTKFTIIFPTGTVKEI